MPRPKSILWVDDEIEGLAAHRRFLEGQGFTVEQAAHGDDALALLRRQPYSVVLLDEQMPGRRGLELLTGPALHLQGISRPEAILIEERLAAALSGAGLFVQGGH